MLNDYIYSEDKQRKTGLPFIERAVSTDDVSRFRAHQKMNALKERPGSLK